MALEGLAAFNPVTMFKLAGNGFTQAGTLINAATGGQDLGRAAAGLPVGPNGGLKVAGSEQEIPLNEDSLVLSDAMIKIFDGGKLTLGAARTADGKLDRTEFGLSNFEKVDLDKDGKLDQAELYVQLDKATPQQKLEMLQFLAEQSQKAGKVNNTIKWIARGVGFADIASIAAVWILRLGFKVWSAPVAALVSALPPAVAQYFGVKAIEKQIDKMNGLRGQIAQKFDSSIASR